MMKDFDIIEKVKVKIFDKFERVWKAKIRLNVSEID
jgi:hypothetical protein